MKEKAFTPKSEGSNLSDVDGPTVLSTAVTDGLDPDARLCGRVTQHGTLTLVTEHVEQGTSGSATVCLVALGVVQRNGALLAVTLGDDLSTARRVARDGGGDDESLLGHSDHDYS